MSNIVKFETEAMSVNRFLRSSESKAKFKESSDRMQALIDDPDQSDRTKLEAKRVQAIVNFDDDEYERTTNILKRMDKVGLKVVEVKK